MAMTRSQKHRLMQRLETIATHVILTIAVIIVLFPVAWVVGMAFNPNPTISSSELEIFPEEPTLDNFKYVIQETNFLLWLRNSVVAAIGTTLLGIFLFHNLTQIRNPL